MKKYLLPLALAALLSACGGSGGGTDSTAAAAATANAAANTASDAFTRAILALVNATPSETNPPIDVDSVALGTSEDKEPVPIL